MKIQVTRGNQIESQHRVDACVINSRGEILYKDTESFAFFPRSAIKPFQAHLLLESGAFQALNLGIEHLALACASHAGEKIHTEKIKNWLSKLELTDQALRCGTHWPYDEATSDEMKVEKQKPTALHNNCSGKHTGLLSVCRHTKQDCAQYQLADHPIQQAMKKSMENLLQQPLTNFGIDGCSLPAFQMDFFSVAKTFAKLSRDAVNDSSSKGGLIFQAFREYSVLTSGTEAYCFQTMNENKGKLLAKEGAEGVIVAAIPEKQIALLVKAEDGAKRAAQAALDHLLVRFGDLKPAFNPIKKNWAGIVVGEVRAFLDE